MKILTMVLLVSSLCLSQTVYFEDDFNDGNADGWYEYPSPATYEVNSNLCYEFSYYGSIDTYGFSIRGDNGTVMSVPDYSVRVEIIGYSPTDASGVDLRFNTADSTGYACYLDWAFDRCMLGRYDGFFSFVVLAYEPVPGGLSYGSTYWFRFECENHDLRVKVWTGSTGDEPDEWLMLYTDYTYTDNGCMGLDVTGCPPYYDFGTEFDNVTVSAPIGVALEQTTWGGIKACFP